MSPSATHRTIDAVWRNESARCAADLCDNDREREPLLARAAARGV